MLSDLLECRCGQLEDEDTGRLLRVCCHCSMCTAHRKWPLDWAALEQSSVHNLREVPILYQEELDHGWSLLGVSSGCSFPQICASLLSHSPAVPSSDQTVVDQLDRKSIFSDIHVHSLVLRLFCSPHYAAEKAGRFYHVKVYLSSYVNRGYRFPPTQFVHNALCPAQ